MDNSDEVAINTKAKDGIKVLVTVTSVFAFLVTNFSCLCQGYPAPYKTVLARAATRSTILRLPASAFESVFKKYPETLVRVIQVTVVYFVFVFS